MTKLNRTQRTPETMFALILSVAEADKRIRAVFLNGSRANPKIPRDDYQGFDVVFVVLDQCLARNGFSRSDRRERRIESS